MDGLSLNIAQDKISQLRQLFPEVFREDQIDFDALKTILGEQVAPPTQERYGLTWPGKYDAYREIQKQTTATLTPDRANSINFDTSDNVFIEGENLEVLRVLQKSYYGKVKMIYTDPPYNTGNDSFIYPDNFVQQREKYEQNAGLVNEEGNTYGQDIMRRHSRDSGHFHSVWLSMMLPRLYLARNLLREDGVICISIDENEIDNISLLLDEVFGAENFIVKILWKKRSTPPNDQIIGANHEYVVLYSKNRDKLKLNLRERTQEQIDRYKNPDNHIKGPWTSGDLMANVKGGRYVSSLYYPITNPNTREEHFPSSNGNWRFNSEKIDQLILSDEIYFGEDGKGRPKLKRFLSDVKEGITYPTIWDFVPFNTAGSSEMADLLGNMNIFDNPKPTGLITELIKLGCDQDGIVCDLFAGTSTTADAVLRVNKDGGNRRFLCIQINEKIDPNHEAYKAGYKTIADISRARIRKVVEKQSQKQNGQIQFSENKSLGFRAYKLTSTHFKIWHSDLSDPADILEQLAVFQHPLTVDYQTEALFTELLLKAGYSLTVPVERQELVGSPVYRVNNGSTYMALDAINRPLIEALTAEQPQRVITLDKLFNQDNELLSNTRLQLREAGIEFTVI